MSEWLIYTLAFLGLWIVLAVGYCTYLGWRDTERDSLRNTGKSVIHD